jgi:DNA-binding PadR family transcriptional regulator
MGVSETLTPAELTLLGLLVERPRHGYQLEEVIAERGIREWTEIGFSSIYYLIGKLRDRGLVAEVDGAARRQAKARKVFTATPAGRAACADAAAAAVADLVPVFPPVLVGIANQPVIPPARLRAALADRAAALTDRIATVRAAAGAHREAPPFVRALFDYSLALLTAEQAWLTGYRATLSTKD